MGKPASYSPLNSAVLSTSLTTAHLISNGMQTTATEPIASKAHQYLLFFHSLFFTIFILQHIVFYS